MGPKVVIFAGMGGVSECADLDRQAWNAAFRSHGVAWDWSWDVYAELMRPGGDRQLAARFADHLGVEVDAERLDRTHQRIFAARLADGIPLRPGVIDVLRWAARVGVALGLVSRSESEPVRALLKATARARAGIPFDVTILRGDVEQMAPKPDGIAAALHWLGHAPDDALAVVDTQVAARAAEAAGVTALAFPGRLADSEAFLGLDATEVLSVSALLSAWRGSPIVAAE